jgi:preprotein translocase subunit YajC
MVLVIVSACVLFGFWYYLFSDSEESKRQESIEAMKQMQQGMTILPDEWNL